MPLLLCKADIRNTNLEQAFKCTHKDILHILYFMIKYDFMLQRTVDDLCVASRALCSHRYLAAVFQRLMYRYGCIAAGACPSCNMQIVNVRC